MKITYDNEVDAFYILLTAKRIIKSAEVADNIVVDLDIDNNVVGIEVLNFVKKHGNDFLPVFKQIEQSILNVTV